MIESKIEPMLNDALKGAKAYRFPDQAKAHLFMRACFKKSLESCGVFCPPKFKTESERQLALQKLMTAAKVRVEKNRQVLFGEWWNALYVYKKGEMVSFTTEPVNTKKGYSVKTNVKL